VWRKALSVRREWVSRLPCASSQRAILARWLYDRRGSELFEAITALPEYYPTRTERSILSHAASEIAALVGSRRAIVEFGSGSAAKTLILLSEASAAAYVPIDISGEFLRGPGQSLTGWDDLYLHRFRKLCRQMIHEDADRG
jgi:uncharacterized SAM-dependent methyltransferase